MNCWCRLFFTAGSKKSLPFSFDFPLIDLEDEGDGISVSASAAAGDIGEEVWGSSGMVKDSVDLLGDMKGRMEGGGGGACRGEGGRSIALLLDAEATSFLMMGALSPGEEFGEQKRSWGGKSQEDLSRRI